MDEGQVLVCGENMAIVLVLLKSWKQANKENPDFVADLNKIEVFLMVLWGAFSVKDAEVRELQKRIVELDSKLLAANHFLGVN